MFETERLRIRRITESDAGFMLAMLTDPGFIANIGDRGVRTIAEAEAYIRDRVMTSYAAHGFGMFRVSLKEGDEAVGLCGLVRREGLAGPDLGFAYLERHTGRGYGYEAGRGMMAWSRAALGIGPLLAITAPDNMVSARLLAKLGFREVETVSVPGHDSASRLFAEP